MSRKYTKEQVEKMLTKDWMNGWMRARTDVYNDTKAPQSNLIMWLISFVIVGVTAFSFAPVAVASFFSIAISFFFSVNHFQKLDIQEFVAKDALRLIQRNQLRLLSFDVEDEGFKTGFLSVEYETQDSVEESRQSGIEAAYADFEECREDAETRGLLSSQPSEDSPISSERIKV